MKIVTAEATAADDLTQIKGIGPKMAAVLKEADIVSFEQIVDLGGDGLKSLLMDINEKNARYNTFSWCDQADQLKS